MSSAPTLGGASAATPVPERPIEAAGATSDPGTPARPLAAVLAAVGIPMFMVTLDNLVVTTALPVIRTELGASLTDLQWFVNAYTLPFAALLLTAAALGDRVGRRRLFLAGIALFTLASAACALATEPWMLTAARAVQGLAGAAVMPLSLTLLAAAVPDRLRDAAIGIWGGISGLGVAVGPVVGGAVVEGLDWTWIFWLNVPVGLLALLLAATVLRESHGPAARLDPVGLVLSTAGVFALVWGVVHGQDHGWTSTRALVALIGGGVLVVGFLGWETRTPVPMLPLRLFRSRAFSVVNVVAFTFSLGVFGSVFLLAQFFQVAQGHSPLDAGIRTMPWTMAPMVVAPLAGLLVGRLGVRTLVVAGQAMLAVALGWLALASTAEVDYAVLVVPLALAGIGMGLTFAPMSTATMASVPVESRGVASGTNNSVRELGVAVGVAVLASVFAANGAYTSPASFVQGLTPAVLVGAAVVATGALAALLLPRRGQ
ncbi:DHA2 family efflux MFS transporter permease subunit [Micromonospora sp. WMMD1102]|uniref:DHA2 family efflux MFS transporter permease subunit n=1 Tax=Micromonospora sp. WMMD1102 TaxID=3016105 RepID=UPI00241544D9|nr:DHA2 family efflux MFS transporter permease subunit [Micromonospora sp. WMMD1102]MDG4790081.1 DHA2 family efflux MFS transporter permease subunit [Micromonospora sp. WMMD1102]